MDDDGEVGEEFGAGLQQQQLLLLLEKEEVRHQKEETIFDVGRAFDDAPAPLERHLRRP